MIRNSTWIARGGNAWCAENGGSYILAILIFISQCRADLGAQEREVNPPEATNAECEEILRHPLSTLDLNGDGECDERDVTLFSSLVSSCEQERLSRIDRIEKLDLDCDQCVTRRDVEKFRAYCERGSGKMNLNITPEGDPTTRGFQR
jgi:hypothetical protein